MTNLPYETSQKNCLANKRMIIGKFHVAIQINLTKKPTQLQASFSDSKIQNKSYLELFSNSLLNSFLNFSYSKSSLNLSSLEILP